MDKDGLQDISEEVEAIFGRIARGLLGEGFEAELIATMIKRASARAAAWLTQR
jgi:hypothetical protein